MLFSCIVIVARIDTVSVSLSEGDSRFILDPASLISQGFQVSFLIGVYLQIVYYKHLIDQNSRYCFKGV